jgi:monoamine oxidase
MVEGFDAAPLDDISLKSVVAEARSVAKAPAQYRPGGGYGALVDRLVSRLDPDCVKVQTNATVEHVFHQSRGACRVGVVFPDGHEELTADHCLVTAPIGVLRAVSGPGSIRFLPELDPNEKPWEEFGMGQVTKVVLAFHAPRWTKNLPDADFIHDFGALFPTWWQRSASDLLLLTAWAGGPKARTVASYGDRDIVDLAITELARMLGTTAVDVRQSLIGAFHHDFSRDPFSRGAYPYVRPGGSSLVEALAKPVDDTLFFAGDATDSAHFATVAGALASGIRAASEIMRAA